MNTLNRGHPNEGTELQANGQKRVFALSEVTVAALATAVAWQAFRRLTDLGKMEVSSNLLFSPGIVTIVVAIALMLIHQRRFAHYGLSLRDGPRHLKLALFFALTVILIAFPIHWEIVRPHENPSSRLLKDAAVGFGFCAFFPWLWKMGRRFSPAIPTLAALVILPGLWVFPILLAYYLHYPWLHVLFVVAGFILATGFPEEIFYRGFVQSRLNEVYRKRYSVVGIRFGWGLILTTLLFGFIHSLNGVDILHGHFNLNWQWGLASLFPGLIFALIREGTGSILPGALLHATDNIWIGLVAGFISR
jgi:membrane protease YdiL (CAAX protease family)